MVRNMNKKEILRKIPRLAAILLVLCACLFAAYVEGRKFAADTAAQTDATAISDPAAADPEDSPV